MGCSRRIPLPEEKQLPEEDEEEQQRRLGAASGQTEAEKHASALALFPADNYSPPSSSGLFLAYFATDTDNSSPWPNRLMEKATKFVDGLDKESTVADYDVGQGELDRQGGEPQVQRGVGS